LSIRDTSISSPQATKQTYANCFNVLSSSAEFDTPVVSIVVVTYNALDYALQCFEGVLQHTSLPFELIVVDNASKAETLEYLRRLPAIRLIENMENKLWAAGCNDGIAAAHPDSKYVLLLNSDTHIRRTDWLNVLVQVMERGPNVAQVGTKHIRRGYGPVYGWPDGSVLLIRREMFAQFGPLDHVRWPWAGSTAEQMTAAFTRGWIYKIIHPKDRLVKHFMNKSFEDDTRKRLRQYPDPKALYLDTLQRHGIAPKRAMESFCWLQPFARVFDWWRFYYTPRQTRRRERIRETRQS
jgi:glycosyltransferase involved in cell wall biosynthesis